MDTNECNNYLIEKIWDAYKVINSRRIRSFYYLYIAMLVFGIIILAPVKDGAIEIFSIKIQYHIAIMFSPAVILILYNSFLFLSAHTILLHVQFTTQLYESNNDTFKKLEYSFLKLLFSTRIKDLTEILNFFKFPYIESLEWEASLSPIVKKTKRIILNFMLILTLVIPTVVYIMLIKSYIDLEIELVNNYINKLLLWFYFFVGSSFILSPIFFLQRVKPYNKYLKEKYKIENEEYSKSTKHNNV